MAAGVIPVCRHAGCLRRGSASTTSSSPIHACGGAPSPLAKPAGWTRARSSPIRSAQFFVDKMGNLELSATPEAASRPDVRTGKRAAGGTPEGLRGRQDRETGQADARAGAAGIHRVMIGDGGEVVGDSYQSVEFVHSRHFQARLDLAFVELRAAHLGFDQRRPVAATGTDHDQPVRPSRGACWRRLELDLSERLNLRPSTRPFPRVPSRVLERSSMLAKQASRMDRGPPFLRCLGQYRKQSCRFAAHHPFWQFVRH